MDSRTNGILGDFLIKNAKTVITSIIFLCGLYIQYQASMLRVEQLEREVNQIKLSVDAQYVKLDNMKLDKAVFEATIKQFTDMSTDIRQIRTRLEDMMGNQPNNSHSK